MAPFFPQDPARNAETAETNRGREERRKLRLQDTTPEQVCFVAARQIGELRSTTRKKKAGPTEAIWPIITSADPKEWAAADLLRCRRKYWGIEAGHQRLDITLDEDRSRIRTPKAMTLLGMFRRVTVSFACAWLAEPHRRRKKLTTRDFLDQMKAKNARQAFTLVTSLNPTAWKSG